MAKLTGPIQFIGSIDGITAYKNKDSDDIIIRKTGSPSKNMIKTHDSFENTRRNNREFDACSKTSKFIRRACHRLQPLFYSRLAGKLTGFVMPLLDEDTENEWGKRNVYLSKNPQFLNDYDLNFLSPFQEAIKKPLAYTLSRETLSATITIPALEFGKGLSVSNEYPYFSFIASLGIVPDLFFDALEYTPSHNEYINAVPTATQTEWFKINEGSPELLLNLTLPKPPVDNACSLMLTVGLCFGKEGYKGKIKQEKRAGSAKIIEVISLA